VKKMGSETPASAMIIANRSKNVPGRSAESTPISTPVNTQMTAAPRASESVTGKREVMSGHTGRWFLKE